MQETQETQVRSLGQEDPLEEEIANHTSILAWKIPCTEENMHAPVFLPAFTHRVAFEEVSGHRVLIKSGLGNRGLSACGTTRELRLEFPRETGLILKSPVKVGNPLHTKQGK